MFQWIYLMYVFFLFKLESPQEAQLNEQAFEMMKDFLPEVNF